MRYRDWPIGTFRTLIFIMVISAVLVGLLIPVAAVFENSDALYLPALFADIYHHPESVRWWRLPPAAYYVPDMPVYGLASLFFRDFRAAVITAAVLQMVLFLSAGAVLHRQWGGRRPWAYLTAVLIVFGGLVVVFAGLLQGSYSLANWIGPIVNTGFHFGAVLGAVWGTVLVAQALRQGSTGVRLGLATLTAACAASDLLFVNWFVIPAVIALIAAILFDKSCRRVALLTLLAILLPTVGVGIEHAALSATTKSYLQANHHSYPEVFRFIGDLFLRRSAQDQAFVILLTILFGGTVAASLKDGADRVIGRAQRPIWISVTVAVLALGAVGSVLAAIIFRLITVQTEVRYLLPVMMFPLLYATLRLAALIEAKLGHAGPEPSALLPLAAGMLVSVAAMAMLLSERTLATLLPKPAELACLAADMPAAGLADYWHARPLTLASTERLQVEPVMPNGVYYWWINSRRWFSHSFADRNRPPDYRFIVMTGLNSADIAALYGVPSRKITCGGQEIWFYDEPGALTATFLRNSRPD